MVTMGERIKTLRKSIDISQREFSKRINISQGSLSDIEKGRNKPSIETLISISTMFNVSLDWLINGELNKNINKNTEILIQQITNNLIKKFHEEKQKIVKEATIHNEIIDAAFDHVVVNLYRSTLTNDQLNLLESYKGLSIKDL